MLRFAPASLLCLALLACGDGSGPPPPPPPVPPPPPAPAVALVTAATEPSRLAIQNDVLYWLDATDVPFKKLALTGSATPAGLFQELPAPEAELSDGSFVYWVGGDNLYRTTLDGSTTILLDDGIGRAAPVMTMDASHIYWVNGDPSSGCSVPCKYAIRRVPKGGGAATPFATTDDAVLSLPAIALAGDYLFWEEGTVEPVDSSGSAGSKIMKAALADGTITTVVDGRLNGMIPPPSQGFLPASWRPSGGLVADTDFVYFGDAVFEGYRVMAVPVAGGSIDILHADTTYSLTDVLKGMTHDDSTLYWIDENDVRSLPKSGGSVTDLAAARTNKPNSITRVGTNLYWIEANCCLVHGKSSIYRIPTAGGMPAVVHDSLVTPVSIASDASHLLWIEGGHYGEIEGYAGLRASALDGTSMVTIVEAAGGGPFATDGSAIYFANGWTIKKVSTAGGNPQRLAIGGFTVEDVATDGTRVYWVEDGPFSVVRSVAVTGGPVTTLGSGPGPAGRIRIDGTYVYWLGHVDEIHRVPKAGGTPVTLVGPVPGGITDFDIDATNIYISEWDARFISKAPLAGGARTPVFTPPTVDQTRRIAANGGKVYWTDQLDVRSVTADGLTMVPIHSGILTDPLSTNELAFNSQSVFWTEIAMDAIRKATPK